MNSFLKMIWLKYQVFILGLLSSIAFALQTVLTEHPEGTDMKIYWFAIAMAILSYISAQWRGKGVTIFGIIGTLSAVFLQLHQTGTFTCNQFILYGMLAVICAIAPPAKPATYETNGMISQAKEPPK